MSPLGGTPFVPFIWSRDRIYLILFAPHAFVPQRQKYPSGSSSPPAFLPISTDFTPTPAVPATPGIL